MNRVKLYGAIAALACLIGPPDSRGATQTEGAKQSHVRTSPAEASPQVQSLDPAIMAQWLTGHPEIHWMKEELERHTVVAPADNSDQVGRGQGSIYADVTKPDTQMWQRETYKLAVYGSTVFHSAKELRGTIGVSCDMCHPNGANTHPETYPKFQEQLGRVALLRDMINWCIEHPVKGKPLSADDPKMRALEAYLYAQRKGVALDYGKH
jgi:thiosulfate dehydrogenase